MALPVAALAGAAALPGIAGMFIKQKKSHAEGDLRASLERSRQLADLIANPDDPRYQKILETERGRIRGDYLSSLRDLVEANRRQALLGRQQVFDPERRDESVFSGIVKAGSEAKQRADQAVINRLQSALSGLSGYQSGLGRIADMENLRNRQRRQDILAALGAGSKAIGMFGGRGTGLAAAGGAPTAL